MAIFNSSMFSDGAGILPNGYKFQIPDWARAAAELSPFNAIPRAVMGQSSPFADYQNAGGNVLAGQFVAQDPNYAPATFAQRFDAMPSPEQKPQAPQFQPPAQAAAAIDMPSGSYPWGNTNVPVYGQAENPAIPPNATPTTGRSAQNVTIDPQAVTSAAPAASAANSVMEFLSAIRPGFVGRYEAKKTQTETARNMYALFLEQGMSPKEAAAKAMVVAQNPKVLEEIMKPYSGMEQRIANQPGGAGGSSVDQYAKFLEKKNAAEKAGTTKGESQATAQINLPGAISAAKEQLRLVDELANHPGRKQYGWHDLLGKAPLVPSTKGFDADNLLTQIKSGAFMTAFETLKGGGQITETEGQKATAAIARMDRATSKSEFDKALEDYRGVIKLGIDRASQKAGQEPPFGFQGNSGWTVAPNGNRIRQVR